MIHVVLRTHVGIESAAICALAAEHTIRGCHDSCCLIETNKVGTNETKTLPPRSGSNNGNFFFF